MKSIGILGLGNMGGAIAAALGESGYSLTLFDNDREKTEAAAKETGGTAAASVEDLLGKTDRILIAVKPQTLPSLYETLADGRHSFVSIAAGVPLKRLTESLKTQNVVRLMPDLAARVGKAVTALAPAPGASDEIIETATDAAKAIGSVFFIPEELFSAFIGVSGSGIAYFFELFRAMSEAGEELGISDSRSIVLDTALAAATYAKAAPEDLETLVKRVCSPGGTTIEGMNALDEGGFAESAKKAVKAAAEKSKTMEAKALS